MPRALWLLFRLRFVGWFRRIGATFRTTKGALLTIVTLLVVSSWLVGTCTGMAFSAASSDGFSPEAMEEVGRFAPFALLLYCLLVVTTSGKTVPITFTPAEIQFLFSAPFTRRQLLSYKLINQLLLSLPISVFMGIGLRHVSGSTPQALVSAFLAFTFLQFFALAWNFIAATVGELAFSRTRRAILLVLVLALAWAAGRAMQFK